MTSEPLCCPYCNAYITLPAGTIQEGQRLLCSRCGDTFAFRGFPRDAITLSVPHPLTAHTPQPEAASVLTRRPWSNRTIAGMVLAIMAGMALAGVVLSLATQEVRREHDAGLPKSRTLPLYLAVFVGIWVVGLAFVAVRELQVRYQRTMGPQRLPLGYILATITFLAVGGLAVTMLAVQISAQRASRPALDNPTTPLVQAVPPASLSTLGYLPPDTDFIAGVHVAEALADPLAKDFLIRFQLGGEDASLNTVEKWTGLAMQDIDHVVLGLRIRGNLLPRMTLIVRTRRPYDAEAIRKKINASRAPEPGKKELYRVTMEKSLVTPHLWFTDERTLIVGLSGNDLEPVPARPREGVDHLMPELKSFLKDRLSQGTPAWMIGNAQDWDQTLTWNLLFAQLKKDGQPVELLAKVRTFGVSFQFNEGMALNAAFLCMDETTASRLEMSLHGWTRGNAPFRMPAPKPELEPLYRELGQSLKTEQNNAWIMLQAKASAETMRKAFNP
jgi:hypothetical protein